MKFSNLTHARPRPLFTLILSYKRRHASHKKGKEIIIKDFREKKNEEIRIQEEGFSSIEKSRRIIWIYLLLFSTYIFLLFSSDLMNLVNNILMFVFLIENMNQIYLQLSDEQSNGFLTVLMSCYVITVAFYSSNYYYNCYFG